MEIQRQTLLETIRKVLPAVAKKELFEQADRIVFADGRVVAFDDRMLISAPLPGGLALEGAVDGRRLADLLGKLEVKAKEEDDVVTVVADNDKLLVRAGRSRCSFDLLPVNLPIDSVEVGGDEVELPEGFAAQLRWASTSCAKDESRPALACVLVGGGHVLATDSYRASRVRHGDADLPRLMLPVAQVEVLVDHPYPIRRVALGEGGEWARFEAEDGTTLCVRTRSNEFPDLERRGTFAVEGAEVELPAAMTAVLQRAGVFAEREHAVDEEVGIEMRSGQIIVSASCDGGSFSEVVRCEGAVAGVAFSIHPERLALALESGTRCTVGVDRVRFAGADWVHIIVLKSV